MPGFPRDEQLVLASLVLAHRRRFDRTMFRGLPPAWQRPALRLAILLRLAALFRRSRTAEPLPELRLRVQGRNLRLQLPPQWLDSNPLTLADLDREREYLDEADFTLVIQRRS
jgi:exopolyphosphatase/guanosine-5'-triphosphate,3'-diphosphate pyrophosphatase